MDIKQRAKIISDILKLEFPTVETPLTHNSAFQLLIAVMLSAQTLDTTVNKVTPTLFERYKTMQDFANANADDIAEIIRVVNFAYTKAKHIVETSKILLEKFNGIVPSTIAELITLPGVGRKTANVVISEWFVKNALPPQSRQAGTSPPTLGGEVLPEGFVVDTHVKRVTYRLGLTKQKEPEKVEQDLMKLFPKAEWDTTSLRIIFHGRKICKAQRPLCEQCPLKNVCPKVGVKAEIKKLAGLSSI